MTHSPTRGIDIFDPVHLDEPNELYRTLREHSPVHRVAGTDFFLVSTWDLVTEAANRTEVFSSTSENDRFSRRRSFAITTSSTCARARSSI